MGRSKNWMVGQAPAKEGSRVSMPIQADEGKEEGGCLEGMAVGGVKLQRFCYSLRSLVRKE